jgi:hypothetical protein
MASRNLSSSCGRSACQPRATSLGTTIAALALSTVVAVSSTMAQTTTPVPASALAVESWMPQGSVSVQSPTSALVGQASNGYHWDVSFFVDANNNPDVYNAIKTAATNGGSLDYTVRFDPSLIVVPGSQPTFIGVNSFYQSGVATNNFIQNYNLPILGSADFPLTSAQTFNMSLPIAAWTDPTVPGNGSGSAYFEPAGTWYKVGFGLNFDNASSAGFYLENMGVTAVPEPASLALSAAALAALAGLRLRRHSRSRPVPQLDA